MEKIHEFVYKRKHGVKERVGIIVGICVNKEIRLGWSKVALKLGDEFELDSGMTIALERAQGILESPEIPLQMIRQYRSFQMRCINFFQQGSTLVLEPHRKRPEQSKPDLDTEDKILGEWFDLLNAFATIPVNFGYVSDECCKMIREIYKKTDPNLKEYNS